MCEIKVDSRRNTIFVIASGACHRVAIHKQKADSREAYFAGAKFMDRHALQSKARDDRETSKVANPNHTKQKEVDNA